MKTKILIVITMVILLASINNLFAREVTREEMVGEIQKVLIDIYTVEVAYYDEFNQYTDNLEELGIDPEAFSRYWLDYWDIKLYLYDEGFIVEARGVKSPVFEEIWSIDHADGMITNRLLGP